MATEEFTVKEPRLLNGYQTEKLASDPSDLPASGDTRIYMKTDNKLYRMEDDGSVFEIAGGTGGGSALTVQEEGSNVDTDVTVINFIGADVTVTSGGAGTVDVTVSGVGGGAGSEQLLTTTTGIDGTTTGQTNVFTASGNDYVISKAVIRLSVATSITSNASASIGVATGFDDVFPSTVLEGLSTTGKSFTFTDIFGSKAMVLDGETLKFDIDTAYTATTATMEVDLFGYST